MIEDSSGGATADKGSPCPPGDVEPTPAAGLNLPRPPAPGAPVKLAETAGSGSGEGLFRLTYCDESYLFAEGDWGRFGRDDEVCQIAVWAEITDVSLSRVAGEIWCAAGEIWVRNLSSSHELVVQGAGRPQWLARREPGARGPACSMSPSGGSISAPTTGDWRLDVVPVISDDEPGPADPGGSTVRVGPVPERLLPVARALCAPLLESGSAPATYDDIARALDITKRQARRYVEQLCDHYRDRLPAKVLPPATEGMPAYQPLAQLLVSRGLITR